MDGEPGTPKATAKLTKADIPTDISPELKGLIEKLLSDDFSECQQAVRASRELRERAAPAVPFLVQLWQRGDILLQTEAFFTLREIGDPAVDPCLAAMRRSSGEKRLSLIEELGQFNNTRMLKAVAALLDDADVEVRRKVAWSFFTCSDPCVVPPLIRAFKDPDAKVREDAIWHFTNFPDPRALEPLLDALKDKEASVRDNAAHVLYWYKDDRVTPALLEVFRNPREDARVRCTAGFHLNITREPRAFEAAMAALRQRGEPPSVRATAAEILATLKDPRSSELMEEVAKEEGPDALRFWAAIGTVNHRNGAVDDVRIVDALWNFSMSVDGVDMYENEKKDALRLVAENGSNSAVRAAARNARNTNSAISLQLPISQSQVILIVLIFVGIGVLVLLRLRSSRQSLADATVAGQSASQVRSNDDQPYQNPGDEDRPSIDS
jgi:HEAT repeat protein